MIRRGFWLTAGAVLGVVGYRRATRMVDGLTRGRPGYPPRSAGNRLDSASNPVPGRSVPGRSVPGRPVPGRPMSTAARIGSAVGFARDVRDGVAEYLELHHRELARNLGGRSNRTSSG